MQKGPFTPSDLAENVCVDSQTSLGSGPKSWQMSILGSKTIVKGSGGVVCFFLSCLVVCIYVSPPLWQVLFVSLYCVLVFVVMCPNLSGMFCVCLFHVFLYPLLSDRSCVFLFHMFLCGASFVSFFFMCFFVLLTLASLVCFSLLCLTLPTSHRAVCIDWIGSTSNIFPKIETFLSLFVP